MIRNESVCSVDDEVSWTLGNPFDNGILAQIGDCSKWSTRNIDSLEYGRTEGHV